jgi:hypothetical protein
MTSRQFLKFLSRRFVPGAAAAASVVMLFAQTAAYADPIPKGW